MFSWQHRTIPIPESATSSNHETSTQPKMQSCQINFFGSQAIHIRILHIMYYVLRFANLKNRIKWCSITFPKFNYSCPSLLFYSYITLNNQNILATLRKKLLQKKIQNLNSTLVVNYWYSTYMTALGAKMRQEQVGSGLLSPEENQIIAAMVGSRCQALATTVVQVFLLIIAQFLLIFIHGGLIISSFLIFRFTWAWVRATATAGTSGCAAWSASSRTTFAGQGNLLWPPPPCLRIGGGGVFPYSDCNSVIKW